MSIIVRYMKLTAIVAFHFLAFIIAFAFFMGGLDYWPSFIIPIVYAVFIGRLIFKIYKKDKFARILKEIKRTFIPKIPPNNDDYGAKIVVSDFDSQTIIKENPIITEYLLKASGSWASDSLWEEHEKRWGKQPDKYSDFACPQEGEVLITKNQLILESDNENNTLSKKFDLRDVSLVKNEDADSSDIELEIKGVKHPYEIMLTEDESEAFRMALDKAKVLNPRGDMSDIKTISETKCTCSACGKVWHYGKEDSLKNAGNAMQNCGKSMMCCSGCFPAVFIGDKKVEDLNKCPQCGSRSVKTEKVSYEVPK